MKVTPALKEELANWLDTYWTTYLKGDIETWATFIRDDYRNIGGTKEEIWNSKQEIIDYTNSIMDQMLGTVDIRNRKVELIPYGEYMMVHEFTDLFVKIEGEWTFYGPFRMSTLLEKTETGWIALHQHGSYPDMKAMEGEAFSIDALKAENAKLQAAVKSRTLELEQNNRELEIEAATERVRVQSMAMQHPDDLDKVNKEILNQLKWLQIEGLSGVTFYLVDEDGWVKAWDFSSPGNIGKQTSYTLQFDSNKYEMLGYPFKILRQTDLDYFVADYPLEKLEKAVYEFEEIDSTIATVIKEALATGALTHQWSACVRISNGLLGIDLIKPPNEDTKSIVLKIAGAFNQAYTRFLDLQKAEAQAREADIELAMERVRARTMAMQHSDELIETSELMFEQIKNLGVKLWSCGFSLWHDDASYFLGYNPGPDGKMGTPLRIPLTEDIFFKTIRDAKKRGDDFLVFESEGESLEQTYRYMDGLPVVGETMRGFVEAGFPLPTYQVTHCGFFSNGHLMFISQEPNLEAVDIFKRFTKVFNQTYTRFLDLQKAEAQAREAEIELALERVRARTMAMQHSEELVDVATVLFQQVKGLGVPQWNCGFNIWNIGDKEFTYYPGSPDGIISPSPCKIPLNEHAVFKRFDESRRRGDELFLYEKEGEEQADHYRYMLSLPGVGDLLQSMLDAGFELPKFQIDHLANFAYGNLIFITYEHYPKMHDVFKRFAKVFEQTYTRFLDLQKAEAQAREAQIEAGLERVRSRSLAMHNTCELQEVIHTVHKELLNLNIAIHGGSFIAINRDIETTLRCWGSGGTADTSEEVHLPLYEKPFCTYLIHRIKSGPGFFTEEYTQEEKIEFFTLLSKHEPWSNLDAKQLQETLSSPGGYTRSCCVSKHTSIFIINHFGEKFSSADNDILQRFGKVFEQTYTRFLDLQKAEAQAREAKIEAALERTRTQSMLMQHSDEIKNISAVFHQQLLQLNIPSEFSYVWLPDEQKNDHQFWASWAEDEQGEVVLKSKQVTYPLDKTEPYTAACFTAWEKPELVNNAFTPPIEIPTFFDTWQALLEGAEKLKAEFFQDGIYYAEAYMKYGCFGINIRHEISAEEKQILKRFSVEFERAYTRFLDLQKAEAQAREAKIEAALEKARARTMGMQSSDELPEVANVLFLQVQALGIPAWSCGYNILDEDKTSATCCMSSEGTLQTPFKLRLFGEASFAEMGDFFRSEQTMLVQELGGKALEEHYAYMKSFPDLKPTFDEIDELGLSLPTYQINHLCKFTQGFLLFITYEKVPDAHDTFKRFTKVFDQTYTRFLDLQKAEAQARDARIETALEKVRSRTMGMRQSHELGDVATVLFKELNQLVENLWTCGFVLCEKDRAEDEWWLSTESGFIPSFYLPNVGDKAHENLYNAWKEGKSFHAEQVDGADLTQHYEWLMKIPVAKKIFDNFESAGFERPVWQKLHGAYFSKGYLCIITRVPCHEEEIFKRFAQVFDLTYTRFLDLQNAEAQAREAQIETALEKVRSRTMAMHNSQELNEVALELRKQMGLLGQKDLEVCAIHLYDDEHSFESWSAMKAPGKESEILQTQARFPNKGIKIVDELMKYKKRGSKDYVLVNEGEKSVEWLHVMKKHAPQLHASIIQSIGKLPLKKLKSNWSVSDFSGGALIMVTYGEPDAASRNLLRRTANVFEQAYIRFLDLQKAEAQAREAQIEMALERVRSRSLAMHSSGELGEVVIVVLNNLTELGYIIDQGAAAHLAIFSEGTKDFVQWSADPALINPVRTFIPYTDLPILTEFWDARQKGHDFFANVYSFEEKNTWFNFAFEHSDLKYIPAELKKLLLESETYAHSIAIEKNSAIIINSITGNQLSENQIDILRRFSKVFEQAYVRFLDLQKAEEQAKESQIQLALERVRARTMAMQQSNELPEAANVLFQQVQSLNMPAWSAGYCIWDEELPAGQAGKQGITLWMSSEGVMQPSFHAPLTKDPSFIHMREAYEKGQSFHVEEVGGKALVAHYKYMRTLPVVGGVLDSIIEAGHPLPTFQIFHCVYFSQGFLLFITYEPVPQAHEIFKRFGNVFDQTYTRFLDLQKAEAQTREAEIELALERVRARTMAMQKSDELQDTSLILFQQLKELGEPAEQCTIGIIKESEGVVEISATLHGTKMQQTFRHKLDEPFGMSKIFKGWKAQQKTLILEIKDEELQQYNQYRNVLIGKETFPVNLLPSDRWIIHVAYFSKGMLALSTNEPRPVESLQLLERFAIVFEQTYTRFLDLQKAEAQSREAQIETALERVRSRSMAMQKSEELKEVIKLVYQQLIHLKINLDHAGFVVDYDTKGDWHFWIADEQDIPSKITHPYFESVWANQFIEAKEKGKDIFSTHLNFEEKNKFYQKLLSYVPGLPETSRDFYLNCPGLAATTVLLEDVALYIEHFTTIPFTDEENKTVLRFGKVFQQTYTRFLDLQKAEAQVREAEIELALERVRARTMAMQHSDELADASFLLDSQVRALGIKTRGCAFNIYGDNESTEWFSSEMGTMPVYKTPRENIFLTYYEEGQKGMQMYIDSFEGDACAAHYDYLCTLPVAGQSLKKFKESGGSFPVQQIDHVTYFKYGYLLFITLEPVPEAHDIFKRFAKVFEQTYTRFLDLQKAEEQAREAQIELGLERVRARAMAMQKSDELAELVDSVFKELTKLHFTLDRCIIIIVDEKSESANYWMANPESKTPTSYHIMLKDIPYLVATFNAWKERKAKIVYDLKGDEKSSTAKYLFSKTELKLLPAEVKEGMMNTDRIFLNSSFKNFGGLQADTIEPLSEENLDILYRFAKVFDLTYTRFNDLQKAEAQAREAQIELGLERVRARAMAMQKSDELSELVDTVFKELTKLDFALNWCIINIIDAPSLANMVWAANPVTNKPPESYLMKFEDFPFHHSMLKGYKERKTKHVYVIEGKEKKTYDDYLFNKTEWRKVPKAAQAASRAMKRYVATFTFSNFGGLQTVGEEYLSEENLDILSRFGKVFDLTYTRFNDLQKAEAQAREAQIEAALERVRSRTMAMQHSNELTDTARLLFQQIKSLGVPPWSCGFNIWEKGDTFFTSYMGSPDGVILEGLKIPLMEQAVFIHFHESRERGDALFIDILEGDALEEHYSYFLSLPEIKKAFEKGAQAGEQRPTFQINHLANFSHGNLMFITYEPCPEAHDIFKRFAKVFEQTYTRFLDLQKAEAQTREAQIETALEKVRSRTMAMQSSNELQETAAVLFQEFKKLGADDMQQFTIGIYNEEERVIDFRVTSWAGGGEQENRSFQLDMDEPTLVKPAVAAWKSGKKSAVFDLTGDALQGWLNYRNKISGITINTQDTGGRRVITAAYFSRGHLTISTLLPLQQETIKTLERFATVFDGTYTRFLDLEKAEAQAMQAEQDLVAIKEAKQKAEDALAELQVTQKQLIQSEKMASLGELTAGIAHEIQNPLNFVNNFSEVSTELVDEMNDELNKGNIDEAKEIANDLKQNLGKINHHGKRAGDIVKGMLQHSRSSSGVKEPTDINALADEYLRLAYHGLRAKDKSFNATMKTEYDETIGNTNIIPQDIGRVILNLITNAFYVVNEKSKQNIAGYEPTVSISTSSIQPPLGGRVVQIKVADNGGGIPQKILDKIFQPFFTTKPTGQGTGLGLSLSYDIVKAHGGELKVETKENDGTEFIIQLPIN